MEAKTTEWRPGPTVCRCCLAEGCYKDISTEYFWMGKREVYAEMLLETFDLNVSLFSFVSSLTWRPFYTIALILTGQIRDAIFYKHGQNAWCIFIWLCYIINNF
ncbi:hypothetical protein KGM_205249 [Danaus plexippus plexippus]|uniref:Uncharacterized protein n=1 Tax=Danaus plexippus plexippus TaxID=278856 RepID=A0A212FGJ5_DANPL|nr:hypothetical protein KGM_205249 [Danaus plexippus plexippus]